VRTAAAEAAADDAAIDPDAITAGTAALFGAIQHAWDQRLKQSQLIRVQLLSSPIFC
jgi:hypothetical protein